MAFSGMFGSGVNGLFTGMSDALKIYSLYQNAQQTQAQIDNANTVKKAMEDEQNQLTPAGGADQNIWGGGVNPNDPSDPNNQVQNTGTTTPASTTPTSTTPATTGAAPTPAVVKATQGAVKGAGETKPKKGLDSIGPPPGATTPTTDPNTGAALTPNAPITPSPAAGAAAASGLQTPAPTPATTPEQQGPPASAAQPTAPKKWADMTQAERDQALKDRTQAAGGVAAAIGKWAGAGVPAQVGSGLGPSVTDITGAPTQPTPTQPAPTTPAPTQPGPPPGGPGAIGSGTSPLTGAATLPPGQSPTVNTAGMGPAPAPPPSPPAYNPYPGRAQQGPPQSALQPPQQQGPAVPAPTPAPPAGAGVLAPTGAPPQQSASLGSRILGAFNPVGSAQAAEPRPTLPPAATDNGPTPAPTTPAPTTPAPTTPAPAAAVGPGSKPTVQATPAPATAPAANTPAQQQTGPAQTTKPVAPDQQGATQTSEAPPKVQAPEFDHRPYLLLQRDHPDEYALINKVAGEEHANPAQLALLWHLESNMQPTSINSAKGAVGPLQILPSTARMVDPEGKEDITTLKGGLTIAARIQHLIIEPKFGVGTPSSFIAYQGGNGSADDASKMSWGEFAASHPEGAKYLNDAYGVQPLAQGMFTPDGSVNMQQFVNDGIAKGPDGALQALVNTGPAGMSMSNLWKQAEVSGVYAALMRGDQQGAMAARDFVFQMSHAGAVSNLMAADKALIGGDGQGAAQYLAKAHAFFPDGTYGQFGVDNSGKVWGQRFDETTGKSLGQPFQITHEGLATQLVMTQDPNKYREMVAAEQKNAATLRLDAAHAQYYQEMPTARTQNAALMASTRLQIASQQQTSREKIAAEQIQSREAIAGARADNEAKHQQGVEKESHDLYTPDSQGNYRGMPGVTATDPGAAAAGPLGEIYTAVRNSPQQDGGHLSSPFAQTLARTIAQGGQITFNPTRNKTTGEAGPVEMRDTTGSVRGYLSPEQASRLMGLGLIKVPAGNAPPGAPPGTGQRAAIGGGAGSPQVAMGGGGVNLANQPYQMPQPAQAIG